MRLSGAGAVGLLGIISLGRQCIAVAEDASMGGGAEHHRIQGLGGNIPKDLLSSERFRVLTCAGEGGGLAGAAAAETEQVLGSLNGVADHISKRLASGVNSLPGDANEGASGSNESTMEGLPPWAQWLASGAGSGAGMLRRGLVSCVSEWSLLWSDAVLEVDRVPIDQQGHLVLSQEPYPLQDVICELLPPWLLAAAGPLCAYKDAPLGRRWSYPCALGTSDSSRSSSGWFGVGGRCVSVGDRVQVRTSPFRGGCLAVDTDSAARWLQPEASPPTISSPKSSALKDAAFMALPPSVAAWVPGNLPVYVLHLAMGLLVICLTPSLSTSRLFHYALSAAAGTTICTLLVAYLSYSELQAKFLSAFPGGSFIPGFSFLIVFFTPLKGAAFMEMLLWGSFYFWSNGAMGYDWLGKAFFAASAFVGIMLTYWYQAFSVAEQDSLGLFGSWTNARANLRRALTAFGVYHLLLGASDLQAAALLALGLLYLDTVLYWRYRVDLWLHSERSRCQRVGRREAERVMHTTTRAEMEKLRAHLNENPALLNKLPPKTYQKVEMFKNGYNDVALMKYSEEPRRSWWPMW